MMHLSQNGRAVPAFVRLPLRQSPARTNKLVDATARRIDFFRPRAPSGAPLTYTLRCRISTTNSANLPRHNKQINVRPACANDVRAMADLTARAFCEQDDLLIYLQSKLGPSFSSLLELIEILYVRISISDIAMQLEKRVGVAENLAHIALVAEHTETGQLMGCLEMGMVKTGKLRSAQTGYAIEQWEKAIAEASMVSGKLSSVEQASVENPGVSKQDGPTSPDRAPYIGNLAVSRNFRRLGVASSLVVEACQQAVQLWNSECVWLHVEARNEAASQLYRKLEFGCEAQDPDWMEEVGKRRRLLLRSSGGCSDWAEAKTSGVKLNGWEYVRWCWNDLARVKRERQ